MVDSHDILPRNSSLRHEFIESITLYKFYDEKIVTLIPEGRIELMFQLQGDFLHNSGADDNWFQRPFSFVGGMHKESYVVRSIKGGGTCLGLSLRPECAHKVIGEKLDHFQDATIDMVDVFGSRAQELNERVMEIDSLQSRLNFILTFLCKEMEKGRADRTSDMLRAALDGLKYQSISAVAQSVGLSLSHFRKRFREGIGLGPKRYTQIQRVNNAIKLIAQYPCSSLTEIAYELDYFDQAHFVREFRTVTGISPKQARNNLT